MMSPATVSNFLSQASLFSEDALSHPDIRLRLRRSLVGRLPEDVDPSLSALQSAATTLDRAILTPDSESRLDLLNRAEKLLLSSLGDDSHTSAIAFLHLCLVAALRGDPVRSARFLLDAFASDPSSARVDLAPKVWEESFLPPLLPLHRRFSDRKQAILASISPELHERLEPNSASDFSFTSESIAFDEASRRKLLSRMSDERAEELGTLEEAYQEALDENTKALAIFLKESLDNSEKKGRRASKKKKKKIFVPTVHEGRGIRVSGAESAPEKTGDARLSDGWYNPMSEEKESATDLTFTSMTVKPVVSLRQMVSTDHLKTEIGSTSSDYSSLLLEGLTLSSDQPLTSSDAVDEAEDGIREDVLACEHKQGTDEQSETRCSLESLDKGLTVPQQTPPKEFVCPITGQVFVDGIVGGLMPVITNLCASGIPQEMENAVLAIAKAWSDVNVGHQTLAVLAKSPFVDRLMEILFHSVDLHVLRATIYLLSELVGRHETVKQMLSQIDPDMKHIVTLLKKGIFEAAALISLLKPSWRSLVSMDLLHSLLAVVKAEVPDGNGQLRMYLRPKTAAILLLMEILKGDDGNVYNIGGVVIVEKALDNVICSIESNVIEERIAAIRILLNCIKEKGSCRNIIAEKANLSPVLGIFIGASDTEWFEIVHFLSELIRINRRTYSEQLLQKIKGEGSFSTMHSLLLYLQRAMPDQRPVIAGLLLQLDLLAELRKMSIYREEAIDALISCLRDSKCPAAQMGASKIIIALTGRFSTSGKPLTHPLLLKRAGFDMMLRAMTQTERCLVDGELKDNLEEEKAANKWERKVAFALVSHEFGLIFEALAEGLKSRYKEISTACFVSATWLAFMLRALPDTGVRGAAHLCLLELFVSKFKSAQDVEERALAMLAMNSFIHDPDGFQALTSHMKDILKILRELKKTSSLAAEMIKVLTGQQDSSADIWVHKELVQKNCSMNGEVLAITFFRDLMFSGHSDGTINVWSFRGSLLHVIQKAREHSKPVTSLVILQNDDKLYSGSLDKTIRVWSIGPDRIRCVQVHDVKDTVHNLVVANALACFIPHGPGVKVHSWNGVSRLVTATMNVKCLALVQGRVYCGCSDGSIQEVDLATGTSGTIQAGVRKLIGRTYPVYALQVRDGLIYSSHAPLDGAPSVKIWSASSSKLMGSVASTADVRSLAVSSELIYLGCRTGNIEVWSREKLSRVGILDTRTNSKVLCLSLHTNGEVLVLGTADGRIQVWEIN